MSNIILPNGAGDLPSRVELARRDIDGNKDWSKVLCVCSAGILRSATTAWLLSRDPYNCNTRCCGTGEYALVVCDDALIQWADVIICMEQEHSQFVRASGTWDSDTKDIFVLGVRDDYFYRQPELIEILTKKLAGLKDFL